MTGRSLSLSLLLVLSSGCPHEPATADGGVDATADARVEVDEALLDEALLAARWLQAVAEEDGDTLRWPEYVGIPAWEQRIAYPVNLYSGVAGVGLFMHALAEVTGDASLAATARAAADRLAATAIAAAGGSYWENEVELDDGSFISYDHHGLYNGAAGIGFALLVLGEGLAEPRYTALARGAGDWIAATAVAEGGGCRWTYSMTDIIGGNAGIVLYLLELARVTGEARYLETARCAGDWLIAQGVAEHGGLAWPADAGSERIYPGFSHGVAGVGYALATLHEATGDAGYLDAARAAATWLEAEALCDGAGCRWHHYRPGGEETFQTGWCHGVAGTARFLLLLARLTGEVGYRELAARAAAWAMVEADPTAAVPGYYGLSFCCGAASVGAFFLDLYHVTGEARYLEHARAIAGYLLRQAEADRGGLAWTNYDAPDSTGRIWYATGLKLGAAGAGWFLLRLALAEGGPPAGPRLLDERL